MVAPFTWGEISLKEGTGKGEGEVVKATCLSLNNLDGHWPWEDTAKREVPEGDSMSLIPKQ